MNNFKPTLTIYYLLKFGRSLLSFVWKYLLIFLTFIAPIHPYLYCVYALIFGDFLSGVYKARKNGELITSKRMRDTVTKLIVYSGAIVLTFLVDKWILKSTEFYLSRLVGGTNSMIELKSNFENFSAILGYDLWNAIKDKLTSYINDKLKG